MIYFKFNDGSFWKISDDWEINTLYKFADQTERDTEIETQYDTTTKIYPQNIGTIPYITDQSYTDLGSITIPTTTRDDIVNSCYAVI
ncbi:MAG: hypothetical protein U9Q15_04560 [Patescibacteria group bacterium]|nr:hypothetical protein [Patescibacteria group bacterium]